MGYDDDTIHNRRTLQSEDAVTTAHLLKSQHVKVRTDSLLPLLKHITDGSKSQKFDAAKALGYMAKTGVMTTHQRIQVKLFLTEVLEEGNLSGDIAFALLESLERVDPDAFWTLVVGWYMLVANKK